MSAPILLCALIGYIIGVLLDANIAGGALQLNIILPIVAAGLYLLWKYQKKKKKREEQEEEDAIRGPWNQ